MTKAALWILLSISSPQSSSLTVGVIDQFDSSPACEAARKNKASMFCVKALGAKE